MSFLTVLLTILKIVGIVLASVVGLIIVLLLWILLSPIRYKGRIRFDGKPDISVRAAYLLHIITVHFDFNGDRKDFSIRLFGHRMKSGEEEPSKTARRKRKVKEPEAPLTEADADERSESYEETGAQQDIEKQPEQHTLELPVNAEGKKESEDKKSIFKKLKDIYNNIVDRLRNIRNKVSDMVNNIIDKRDRLSSEINDPANREGLSFAFGLLKKLLKHILPRKHRIYTRFGTGDPAMTGELVGVIYTVAVAANLNVEVVPDFENKVFECDIPFKGRISVIRLVIWALQAYRNKNFRHLLDKFT